MLIEKRYIYLFEVYGHQPEDEVTFDKGLLSRNSNDLSLKSLTKSQSQIVLRSESFDVT